MGSQTIYKEKGNEITTVINGTFNDDLFKTTLDKFIDKYVCCSKCKYPEMILSVKKGIIYGRCNACGHKNDIDNAHKLAAFIVKNPPDNQSELKKGTEVKNGKKTEVKEKVPEKTAKVTKTKTKEKEEENEKNDGNNSEEEAKMMKKDIADKAKIDDYSLTSKKISKIFTLSIN